MPGQNVDGIRSLWRWPGDRAVELERQLIAHLARAFRDNPMNRAVLRGRSARRRVAANRTGVRLLLEQARWAGHIYWAGPTQGTPSGAIIGFDEPLGVSMPAPILWQLMALLRQGPGPMRRWSSVHRCVSTIRPVFPHWTLAMVGVDPAAQGAGIGRALISSWLEGVDAEGLPAYVETDRSDLVPLYGGFGFEPFAETEIFDVRVFGMLRPAVAPASHLAAPATPV